MAFDTADKAVIFSSTNSLRQGTSPDNGANCLEGCRRVGVGDAGVRERCRPRSFCRRSPSPPAGNRTGVRRQGNRRVACQLFRMRQHPDHARRWPPACCWPRPSSGRWPAQPVNRGDRPLFERTKVRAIDLAQFPFLALRSGLKKTAEQPLRALPCARRKPCLRA